MTAAPPRPVPLERIPTGIPGLDDLSLGGLPRVSTTLLSGTSGSGKTTFALGFLARGALEHGEPGVMVTTERRPVDLARDAAGFGWDLDALVASGGLRLVDATPRPGEHVVQTGPFDLSGLLARILRAAEEVGARRLVIDSLDGVFSQFGQPDVARDALLGLCLGLTGRDLTTILCGARVSDDAPVSTRGVEEFIVDNVVVLRNALRDERRRRTIEIVKFRGAAHQQGARSIAIGPEGIDIVPVAAVETEPAASRERISLGVAGLDEMCSGGVFRDSVVLVSGSTGSGKTLLAESFAMAGVRAGERTMVYSFEESISRLVRNAQAYGLALDPGNDRLRLIARLPERMSAEDLLVTMRREIEEFSPERVALDNVTTLSRSTDAQVFREFIIALVNVLRQRRVATLFTGFPPTADGGDSLLESHFSVIADAVLMLRYLQREGRVQRCVGVLKLRGSAHDTRVRQYVIDDAGMQVREPIGDVPLLGGDLAPSPGPLGIG